MSERVEGLGGWKVCCLWSPVKHNVDVFSQDNSTGDEERRCGVYSRTLARSWAAVPALVWSPLTAYAVTRKSDPGKYWSLTITMHSWVLLSVVQPSSTVPSASYVTLNPSLESTHNNYYSFPRQIRIGFFRNPAQSEQDSKELFLTPQCKVSAFFLMHSWKESAAKPNI